MVFGVNFEGSVERFFLKGWIVMLSILSPEVKDILRLILHFITIYIIYSYIPNYRLKKLKEKYGNSYRTFLNYSAFFLFFASYFCLTIVDLVKLIKFYNE